MTQPTSDLVTVSVNVSTDPATAFDIFTKETDLWWRSGPKFRIAGKQPGVLRFEPWLGGRFIEEVESPSGLVFHALVTSMVLPPTHNLIGCLDGAHPFKVSGAGWIQPLRRKLAE